jgi:hypothetical protein
MKSFIAAKLTYYIFVAAAGVRIDGVMFCRAINSVFRVKLLD